MGVERKVIGRERHVRLEQQLQPVLELGVDRARSRAPEEAVMDQQQPGPLGGRQLEQLGARRHARGEGRDLVRAGYLEAIRTVVLEALRLEQRVELGEDLGEGCGHGATIASGAGAWASLLVWDTGGASGRGAAW